MGGTLSLCVCVTRVVKVRGSWDGASLEPQPTPPGHRRGGDCCHPGGGSSRKRLHGLEAAAVIPYLANVIDTSGEKSGDKPDWSSMECMRQYHRLTAATAPTTRGRSPRLSSL